MAYGCLRHRSAAGPRPHGKDNFSCSSAPDADVRDRNRGILKALADPELIFHVRRMRRRPCGDARFVPVPAVRSLTTHGLCAEASRQACRWPAQDR